MKLGDEVRDKISGLTGIVVCRTEWLHGCIRLGVQPKEVKDGKPVDASYFDELQLELVKDEGVVNKPQAGGPRDNEHKAMSR
jgi:hypothetical protein